jgi:hypothetical protein
MPQVRPILPRAYNAGQRSVTRLAPEPRFFRTSAIMSPFVAERDLARLPWCVLLVTIDSLSVLAEPSGDPLRSVPLIWSMASRRYPL